MVVAYKKAADYRKKNPTLKRPSPNSVTAPQFPEHRLIASTCRDSFFTFVQEFWHVIIADKPVFNWHIEYLCDVMQEVVMRIIAGQKKKHDVCVNIPPGTSKSTIMSIMLPAWAWTRFPGFRFGGVSYAFDLQSDFSRKTRTIVTSEKYQLCFPHVKLRDDQNTKKYFTTTEGGFRYSAGSNGGIMGMHMHLIVIDDPISPEQAASPADLNSINRWLQTTIPTRLVSKSVSVVALVMQRLNIDDPTVHFLKRKKVLHVCLPAELSDLVNPPELARNYRRGLLDPERLDREVLREQESILGQYAASAQYRQDPVPAGGGMFKVDRLEEVLVHRPDDPVVRRIRFWDKAGTSGKGAYTVGVKMAVTRLGRYIIEDVIRGQWDSYAREAIIEKTAREDGKGCEIGIEQEPGSGGKESAENSVRRLAGYRVRVVRVDTSKIDRADTFSVQVNSGQVVLLSGKWVEAYKEELKYFPFSRFKDQVDASSGAFGVLVVPRRRCGGLR